MRYGIENTRQRRRVRNPLDLCRSCFNSPTTSPTTHQARGLLAHTISLFLSSVLTELWKSKLVLSQQNFRPFLFILHPIPLIVPTNPASKNPSNCRLENTHKFIKVHILYQQPSYNYCRLNYRESAMMKLKSIYFTSIIQFFLISIYHGIINLFE